MVDQLFQAGEKQDWLLSFQKVRSLRQAGVGVEEDSASHSSPGGCSKPND